MADGNESNKEYVATALTTVALLTKPPKSRVAVDSGATDHFGNDKKRFVLGPLRRMNGIVRLGDGKEVKVE
jgi:hypothetical protein